MVLGYSSSKSRRSSRTGLHRASVRPESSSPRSNTQSAPTEGGRRAAPLAAPQSANEPSDDEILLELRQRVLQRSMQCRSHQLEVWRGCFVCLNTYEDA
jgi:hypothetical protein